MKNNVLLLGLLTIFLAMGLVLAGCVEDDPEPEPTPTPGATTGTIVVTNSSNLLLHYAAVFITSTTPWTEIAITPNGQNIVTGQSRTLSNIAPGNYTVQVEDQYYNTYIKAIILSAGQTVEISFNGSGLY
jgi:hypothetical protein